MEALKHGDMENMKLHFRIRIWNLETDLHGPAVLDADPPRQAATLSQTRILASPNSPPSRSDPCSVLPHPSSAVYNHQREPAPDLASTHSYTAGRQAGTHRQHTCRPTSNENAPRGEQNHSPSPRPPPPRVRVLPRQRHHAERRARARSPHCPFPKTQSHDADADAPTPMDLPPRPRSLPVPLVGRKIYRCIPSS